MERCGVPHLLRSLDWSDVIQIMAEWGDFEFVASMVLFPVIISE